MSHYYFNLYSIPPLIAALFLLILGLLVLIRNIRSEMNWAYFLMNFSAFIWQIGYFFVYLSKDIETAQFWQRLVYIGIPFLAPTMFHFSVVFLKNMRERFLLIPFYFFAVFSTYLFLTTDILILGVKKYFWGFYKYANVLPYSIFLAIWVIPVFYAIISLYLGFKKGKYGSSLERQQKKYLSIAFIIVSLASLDFLPIYGITLYPFGYLPVMACLSIIAYTIVKYRFMDIRFVISKSILYFFLVLFVALSFTFVTFSTAQFFGGQGQVAVTLLVSLIIVLFLDPLKRLLAKLTDRFFYKGRIDFQRVLRDIGEIIASELDLQKLLKSIEASLSNKIKVKYVKVLIAKDEGGDFLFSDSDGQEKINQDSLIFQYIQDKKEMIITEELIRQKADLRTETEKTEIDKLEAELDQRKIGLIVPIMTKGKMTAIFLVGQKLSGSPFTQEEINFFDILMPQAATALEKSKLFEEVQELNISLQDRVRQATSELEERNRYLMALQKLTSVITRSLDYGKVMQTIADGIANRLGFIGGMLNFINFENRTVSIGAISKTQGIEKILKLIPRDPTSYTVQLDDPDNLAIKAIRTKQVQIAESFWEVVRPAIPKTLGQVIQKVLGARSIVAVPVYFEERVIGVIDFVLAKTPSQITNTEREMMQALADQVGIVSRNLHYYQEIQKANEELKQANIKLQQLDKAKSEFLSIASHQLRTPLTGIKGYLSMIVEGDYGEVPTEIKRVLDDVFLNTDRLTRLINIFLNVSRIESGRFDLALKDVDLIELTEKVIAESKPLADKKKLTLILYKPKKLIPHIKLDNDKIKDVLLNLIDNSIKYTPEGKVEVFVTQDDHQIKISIKDTGVGILRSEVDELFKKFVRGIGIAQIDTSGSGLGLYIAKKIIEAHGGKIWAESEGKGRGATFNFTLPLNRE